MFQSIFEIINHLVKWTSSRFLFFSQFLYIIILSENELKSSKQWNERKRTVEEFCLFYVEELLLFLRWFLRCIPGWLRLLAWCWWLKITLLYRTRFELDYGPTDKNIEHDEMTNNNDENDNDPGDIHHCWIAWKLPIQNFLHLVPSVTCYNHKQRHHIRLKIEFEINYKSFTDDLRSNIPRHYKYLWK